jgi:opacity protein-like surface antigen
LGQQILLILGMFFLAACASVDVDTMNPTLQSPVLMTSEKLGFAFEMGSTDNIKFTEDASYRPPTIYPQSTPTNDIRAQLNYGVNKSFDFSAGANQSMGIILNGRLRLIEEANNPFLLAGTIYFGYDPTNKSGDQSGEFGPGGYNWNADASGQVSSIGLTAGSRLSDNVLVYLHGGVGSTRVNLKIKQDASNGDAGGEYSYNNSGKVRHIGLGLAFGKSTLFTVGVQYTHKEWSDLILGDTSTTHAIIKIESL